MIIKPGANVSNPTVRSAPPGSGAFYTYRAQANKAAAQNTSAGVPVSVGFQPGRGYYLQQKAVGNPSEKPAPVKAPTAPPAPTNPYGLDPAVYSAISPQLTYLNQVQSQNEAALKGLTQAIMQQLGGISGQIGSQYDQGIQQQQQLAQAGADSLRQANGNPGVQSVLSAIGAPAQQQQQISDQLGHVFNGGAAATFGLQGVAPVTRLIADKLANQDYASSLPGIQSVAATNAMKNLLAASSNDKLKVLAQVPQIQSDLAKSKMDAQKFALQQQQAQSTDLYRRAQLGQATRKEAYAEWLGQKKLGLATQNQSFNQWAKTQGLSIQGQRVAIAQQNANTSAARAAQAQANASAFQSKNVNGHIFNFDKTTGTYYIPGTTEPVNPNSFPKAAKVSAAAISKARGYLSSANQGYYASTSDSSTPLTTSQLRSIAKDSKLTLGKLLSISDPNQLAKLGLGYVQVGPHEDQKVQHLYVTLVKKYGIPAQQAFNMVANSYKQWGQAHRAAYFPGKGSAAQGAATAQPTAYTTSKLSPAQLPQLAQQALAIAAPKYANNQNVQALVGRIMQESGGDPGAINLWDSNAKAGHPSKGILQTIDSTFNAYALPGHTDIYNPLDNAIAAIRYMLARYGHIVGPGSGGY